MAASPEPAAASAFNKPCASCGAPWAAFGYSRRNAKALPEKLRKVMWVCGKPACKDRAETWKARADAALNATAPRPAAPAATPAQAALI